MTEAPVPPLGYEARDLLVERLRAGLWLCVVSISLFAVGDLQVHPELLPSLWTVKAVQFATIAIAFWLLRQQPSYARTVRAALRTIVVICFTTAASGILTDDAATTPVLLLVLSMGTATLLPWGLRAQIVAQVAAALAIVWNVHAVGGMESSQYMPVPVVVGFLCAAYVAHAAERLHRQRRQIEAAQAEQQLQRHQAELAQAARMSTLGGMCAGLAHELNQPLAAIVSYAKGCAHRIRSGENPASLLEVIEEIAVQAMRGGEILRRIREWVRHGQLRREAVDLNDLVREAVRLAGLEARQLGITLDVQLAAGPMPVDADAIQVEQVILNLVHNGFDALDGIGPRHVENRTAAPSDEAVEVAVTDTGSGLSADVTARLFDPFFTTKPDGLGLGLSISRSIIEAHGGQLWAVPSPAGGATFRFTLPVLGRGRRDAA